MLGERCELRRKTTLPLKMTSRSCVGSAHPSCAVQSSGPTIPRHELPADYIHATRGFLVLGTLAGAASFFGLWASFCQPSIGSISTSKIAAIASFVAGTCALLAMSVFTGVYVDLYLSWTHASFGWSFALGWASGPLFLATGGLAYKAHPGTYGPTLKVQAVAVI